MDAKECCATLTSEPDARSAPLRSRWISRAASPDRSLGRLLMRLRMHWQTLPLRFATGDHDAGEFLRLCRLVIPRYSMISVDRLQSLFQLSLDAARRGIPGAIVECGTWNGGAAAVMAAAARRGGMARQVWLYDSFEGLPPPTANDPKEVHDAYFKGWCSGHPDLARAVLGEVGTGDDAIHVVKGWFEVTLPGANVGPIAVLHVDADWYESVMQCLNAFYDAVVPGGVIVFDDYTLWGGCRKAVDEFLGARGIADRLNPSGRVARYLIKPNDEGLILADHRAANSPVTAQAGDSHTRLSVRRSCGVLHR